MAKTNKNTIIWIIIVIVGIVLIGPQLGLFATTGTQQQCTSNEPTTILGYYSSIKNILPGEKYRDQILSCLQNLGEDDSPEAQKCSTDLGVYCDMARNKDACTLDSRGYSLHCENTDCLPGHEQDGFVIDILDISKRVPTTTCSQYIADNHLSLYEQYKGINIYLAKIGRAEGAGRLFCASNNLFLINTFLDKTAHKYIDNYYTCANVNEAWSPATSTQCSGVKFFQTSDLGNTREATGTKDCGDGDNGDGKTDYTYWIIGGIGLVLLLVILKK